MNTTEEPKVKRFKCLCGKTRMLSVLDLNHKKRPEVIKRENELIDAGCEVDTLTLAEARKVDLCFDCKL